MTDTKPDNYYEGLNQKLLNVIPAGARNIIEFGCANGRLGEAYKSANPSTHWTGVDIDSDALSQAEQRLDRAFGMDLDYPDAS